MPDQVRVEFRNSPERREFAIFDFIMRRLRSADDAHVTFEILGVPFEFRGRVASHRTASEELKFRKLAFNWRGIPMWKLKATTAIRLYSSSLEIRFSLIEWLRFSIVEPTHKGSSATSAGALYLLASQIDSLVRACSRVCCASFTALTRAIYPVRPVRSLV